MCVHVCVGVYVFMCMCIFVYVLMCVKESMTTFKEKGHGTLQLSWVVFENKIRKIAIQKQPIFLLDGEVNWQASDSPLSKELHGKAVCVCLPICD